MFAESPQKVLQSLMHPATLSCRVSSFPLSTVRWLLNDQPVRSDGRIEQPVVSFRDGVHTLNLVINNVTSEDYGNYTCNAENDLGKVAFHITSSFHTEPFG